MIKYDLLKYLHKNYMRIISVLCALIFIGLYSLKNVTLLLELSGLIDSSSKINMHDYIIGTFNSFQFVMTFALPTLFSIMVSDLILSDYINGDIDIVITRVGSIALYVINKLILLSIIGICFILSFILILLVIGFFAGLAINGNTHHYLFDFYYDKSMIYIYSKTLIKFFIGLIFVGFFNILISLYIKSSAVTVGIIIIIGFIHNIFYILGSKLTALLPFTQFIVGLHTEFYPFGVPLSWFTQSFSNIYLICTSIFIVLAILKKFKKIQGAFR